MKRINEESILMDIPNEVKGMVKEEAIKINKTTKVFSIILFIIAIFTSVMAIYFKELIVPIYGLSSIFFIHSISTYFFSKISLKDDALNKWYWSLPSDSLVVKNVDSLVKEKGKKEHDKESIHLKEYKILTEDGNRLLLFVRDGTEMSFPLNEVEYDEGEKRIEFHVSDRDWTVSIQKDTWFNVKIYNV